MAAHQALTVRLDGDEEQGFTILLVRGAQEPVALGRVERSGDHFLPWQTDLGQLEPSVEVAALKLVAARLEDDHMHLLGQLR
jgi:hypothetical protein